MSSQSTNKLINSTSPYLLQHAHNPVNWQPWSEEALQEAKEKNKLLLISIGYAACHWCHVMEQESFEDKEVAELMNHNFVCIKVDREELPNIDHYYMTSIHLMQKSGGWPLNIIALPDGRTIWGGTYFPKNIWMRNIESVANFYKANPQKTYEYAENLQNGVSAVLEGVEQNSESSVDKKKFEESIFQWKKTLDYELGGTKGAPKFMMPTNLNFLMNYGYQTNDEKLKKYVENTLIKMANGGLYDQIGGGFARYSVDVLWKVPHFEKMLYDNGQLIELYSKAYKLFKRKQFKKVVYQTVDFLQRELMNPRNGYYSSLDADSDGEEGKFYVWSEKELKSLIIDDYHLLKKYYHIDEKGYWENGNYILLKDGTDEEFSINNNISLFELEEKVQRWNNILLKEREKRIRPALDDKTLTSWNALVISGLIEAYKAFDDKQFLDLALKNYEFLKSNLWSENHQLYHSWKEGKATISGYLEDYALLIKASLQLFEVTSDKKYLLDAENLTNYAIENFYNQEKGSFYFSQINKSSVSNFYQNEDNVIPAANSVMANNLYTLFLLTSKFTYKEIAENMSNSVLSGFYQYSSVYSNWGNLYLQQLEKHYELVVVGQDAKKTIKQLNKEYLPNVKLFFSEKASDVPIFKDRYHQNKTLFYICEESACQQPVESIEEALKIKNLSH